MSDQWLRFCLSDLLLLNNQNPRHLSHQVLLCLVQCGSFNSFLGGQYSLTNKIMSFLETRSVDIPYLAHYLVSQIYIQMNFLPLRSLFLVISRFRQSQILDLHPFLRQGFMNPRPTSQSLWSQGRPSASDLLASMSRVLAL